MKTVDMIMVGGFLGAGKTTLLWDAAARLMAQGKRVGLMTNDQAPDLVDTSLLASRGLQVREVAGSCFCCNFPGLLEAVGELRSGIDADVLIAEPVGSCTDLSATILQPLKDRYSDAFRLTPLSVLADPLRLRAVLSGQTGLHSSAVYIIRKQLEEADVVAISKADTVAPDRRGAVEEIVLEHVPGASLHWLSVETGEGVDAWLERVSNGAQSGQHILDIDYDRYAEGEAVLGWLNTAIQARAIDGTCDWDAFTTRFLDALMVRVRGRGAEVGHIKAFTSAGNRKAVFNITRADEPVARRGHAGPAPGADLVLNARVQMAPADLEADVGAALAQACGDAVTAVPTSMRSLAPGRPNPTHRYTGVVTP